MVAKRAFRWCDVTVCDGRRDREDRKMMAKARLNRNNKTKKKRPNNNNNNSSSSCWMDERSGSGSGSGQSRLLFTCCCFWRRRHNNEVSPEPPAPAIDSVDEQRRPRSRFTSPSPGAGAHGRFVSSSPATLVQPQSASASLTPTTDQPDHRLSPRPDTGSGGGNSNGDAVSLPGADAPAAAPPTAVKDKRVSPSPSPSPQPPPPATAADCVETTPPPPPSPPPSPPPQPQLTNTRKRGGGGGRSPVDPVGGSDVPPPLDDPKDALTRCLIQMGDPEWEVTVRGLQTLVQLFCHHPSSPSRRPQHVIAAVTKLVRSLRSQVARVASKAATHLFSSMGRSIENIRETEELCSVLLNRTADTNKFLRGDCNAALDAMVDRFTAPRAVAVVVAKAARHQNAVVRATCCRLLMRICARLGAERALSMPRDARDAVLNAAARGLTEGSLDTRRYAKELLVLLSGDVRLEAMLKEAVPATVMRSIAKALARLVAP